MTKRCWDYLARDEQIENMATTIRNLGKAGVEIFGYHWMPNEVWRTSRTTPGRGGAAVTIFDMEQVQDAHSRMDVSSLKRKCGKTTRIT